MSLACKFLSICVFLTAGWSQASMLPIEDAIRLGKKLVESPNFRLLPDGRETFANASRRIFRIPGSRSQLAIRMQAKLDSKGVAKLDQIEFNLSSIPGEGSNFVNGRGQVTAVASPGDQLAQVCKWPFERLFRTVFATVPGERIPVLVNYGMDRTNVVNLRFTDQATVDDVEKVFRTLEQALEILVRNDIPTKKAEWLSNMIDLYNQTGRLDPFSAQTSHLTGGW